MLMGDFEKKALPTEEAAIKNARRSLVAKKNIRKGEELKAEDLTWKRPASGISPKYINDVVGKHALTDIEEDSILKWSMIS